MITFSIVPLKECWDAVIEMAQQHWAETEKYQSFPMNPDKERYLHYNEIGYHRQYMASRDGEYVGYLGAYVTSSMHTGAKQAMEDNWFLKPEVRGGKTAKRFYEFVEEDLKSLGVQEIIMHSKYGNSSERLMRFLGFTPVGTMCIKRI